jgi:uncharacterized YigZ family protein
MAYTTLARRAEHEEVVRGSRFVALVAPLARPEDAQDLLDEARRRYPDATHHAFAMRWGQTMRASDDGEPGGTAGRPMLEVLLKHDLDHVAAVVVRTFGGTKLGAGGLARAYGGVVARAVRAGGTRAVPDRLTIEVRLPYGAVDAVLRQAQQDPDVAEAAVDYTDGYARVALTLLDEASAAWRGLLADLSRGQAVVLAAVKPDEGDAAR